MSVLWLDEITSADIERAGGKGANLGEMTRAGFPVPPGFCVEAGSYRRQLESGGLDSSIASILSGTANGGFGEASARIRRLIESRAMLPGIESDIRAAYERLRASGHGRVAVRSSATAEDLPDASFAGQQETFLSIRGGDAVVEAVRRCWASAWSERACAYRARMGYAQQSVSIAVVVQAMVEPDTAGVLFTVDPLDPGKDAMLVSASYGLGESVVAGKVTPDTYRLAKGPGALVLEKKAGSKEITIRSAAAGETESLLTPAAKRSAFCLGGKELKGLKELGLAVEARYGKPQDIEWAFSKKRLYLLQARPITTTGIPARVGIASGGSDAADGRRSKSSRVLMDSLREHCPDALLPLEFDLILALQQQKNDIMSHFGLIVPKASDSFGLDGNGAVVAKPIRTRASLRMVFFPRSVGRFMSAHSCEWAESRLGALLSRRDVMRAIDARGLADAGLASAVREFFDLVRGQCEVRFRAHLAPMMISGKLLLLRMRLAGLGRGYAETDLLGGLEYESAAIERDLYALADAVDSLPAVKEAILGSPGEGAMERLENAEGGAEFGQKLRVFLDIHGARTPKAFQCFSNLSWSERPADLLRALAVIVRSGSSGRRSEQMARAKEKAMKIEKAMRRSPFGGKGFRRLLERYRSCCVGREKGLYEIEASLVAMRKLMAESGKRLCLAGLLDEAADVVYARVGEVVDALEGKAAADFRELVATRKSGRAAAVRAWAAAERGSESALSGMPSSPGVYEGPARIISGPEEFPKLEKGDVLVCPFTDPTWTPLFSLAGAVVAELGGPLSHAAIVAREYSIPAVMGVRGAMASIADGQRVRVDGSRGDVGIG
jgi:pyruvate,water dikinase